jgi:phage shock protein E
MSEKNYLYLGLTTSLISILSFLKYYTLSGVNLISSSKAKELIKKGAIVIDVRTKTEWNIGHYKKALHIPVSEINEKNLSKLNKNKTIVVYCNTGQRARKASEEIKKLGFNKVFYIEGTYKSLI